MKKSLFLSLFVALILANIVSAQCPPPGYPPPGDNCPTAPTVCVDLNGYCASLGLNNVNQPFPGCPSNALNNDEWFAFIAGSTTIELQIVPSNCQGLNGQFGMQGAIYEGGCDGNPVATQCGCTEQPFNMIGTFVPGQVYYVVFDGCAGDICDFQVNILQGSTVPIPPADPSPIQGPTNVCPGAIVNYFLLNQNAAVFNWTISPPNAANISGSPGGNITATWSSTFTGTAQLCVMSSNPCFTGGQTCLQINSAPIPPTDEFYEICVGECVTCAGQNFCAGTGPAGTNVPLQNYLGCDSVIVCHVTEIPAIVTNLGMVTLCAPSILTICSQQFSSSEIISYTCSNASWQGCDSTVNVDLAILTPNVVIETPGVIGCGIYSEIQLSANNSDFSQVPGGAMTMLWTGPGILGSDNGPTVQINQPGQYCFTITASRNGVVCTDQKCVTVTENVQTPQMPMVSGNLSPCQGATINYTVTPVGTPAPTSYTWITPNGEPVNPVGGNVFAITWNTPNGGLLCVTADNECGGSLPACITVNVQALPTAPQITGPATVCANNQTQVYSVNNVQNGVTYSWTVPTGATFTGSGASITVNFSNAAAGTGQVCVTAQNACGTILPPSCFNVTITTVPATPSMSGPSSVCNNGGNYTYVVNNPITGVTYNWTAPNGATITGTGDTIQVNFNGAPTGQVCVNAQNSCGTSTAACQSVQVVVAPSGTISGSGTICQGSGDNVNLTITLTGTGPWNVTYTLNNGLGTALTIPTSPYTLSVNQPGTYTLTSVTLANSVCAGTVNGAATVIENPAPVAALSGGGSICFGSGQTVPLTITFTGTGPWMVDWTRNGNVQAPFQANSNPFTWNIGQGQAGNIVLTNVVDANGCDGTTTGSAMVTVNTAPTVSNLSADCDPTTQEFVVMFTINGGNPASYTVTPPNGTLAGNIFTSNPFPSGDGYLFVVSDANNCNPDTISDNAVVCNCISAVGDMDNTPISICGNGPISALYDNATQVFDGNDTLAFVLHKGPGISIVPPISSTTPTPDVSFNPATMTYGTTYYLSAVVGDFDGSAGVDLNDPCLQVAQGTPIVFYQIPTAVLSGSDAICSGDDGMLTVQLTGTGPWNISFDNGSGNIQTLNGISQNPYPLDVTPAATTTYCLTSMSDDNCTGTASGCGTVTVNTGVSVGGLSVDCNPTATAYTVTFTISGGDQASYVVTGVTGTITNGVFTSDLIPTGTGYSLVVDDANGCNPQTLAQTLVNCNCATDAGDMDPAVVIVCGDGPVNVGAATAVNLDADDILQYVLRPDNFGIITTILATSNSPTFSFLPSMNYGATYYISAIAGNDDLSGNVDLNDNCLNVSQGTPVVFYAIPTAILSGNAQICEGASTNLSVQLTGLGPWTIVYQTATGQPTTVTATSSPYSIIVSPTSNSVYSLVSVSNNFCTGTTSGTATVNVNNPPTASNFNWICDPTGQNYTLTFDIQGGDPSTYTVSPPGNLTGSSFTSNPIANGANYSFSLDDSNGCGPTLVTGSFDCNCLTEAGTMSPIQINVCITDMATASPANGIVLDGNDILVYVLHTGSSNALGTVISTSPTPTFSFNAGLMTPGTVYYISAVAGNDNGNGTVNLNDPCHKISVGTPVVFNALPTVSVAGSATICQGETAQFSVTLTGIGPFSVDFTVNSVPQTQIVPTAGTVQLPPVSTTTTVTLIGVTDNGTGCSDTASGSATITVNPNVTAGTSIGNLTFCQGAAQPFDLDDQITGATPGGQWSGPNGVVVGGQVNPTTFADGVYDFTYTVQGVGTCPDDTETVSLTINAAPIADAGQDQTLTCGVVAVPLGGNGTTTGATYLWSGGPVSNPATATTVTSQPGTYVLTVTNQGCTSTDEVVVDISNEIPNMSIIISDVNCFGDSDGTVSIDSVWGGTPPYVFSINNAPFGQTTQFNSLGPGVYSVTLMDAGGCTAESSFSVVEPPEVTVQIVGNFPGTAPTIDLGDELVLSILSTPPSNQLDSILWSTAGLSNCANCPSITDSPTSQTIYTVEVAENGCEASDNITVFVNKNRPVYVPNAFSPNDDGLNDIFTIYAGKSVARIKSFMVFSRWGEPVYEYLDFAPNDPAVGWNGSFRSKELQPAVYTWFAEIEFTDGRVEIYRGDVSLVR
ncbi:MAG: gliding motility-associated C-terminal domain-containing protein [Saprospiraceae bacterium]|nr:gliding motility-associated C-terminal domain-containing protein [Saprospiraceae bacterium]MCF8252575.1 gliding motility-associated C-terminal domain-containing protein [Saprospiraceae bacterium]MCF8282616.1 gliding motility-associated C-terminal domain-containing protein [Bacteroidales bacterium]MCF8314161.1 gliding motility-associated C-terminal domain-containing protein [Saprospiraceae bacterium]MCF8442927.1 gliding motility-associated C-terminal domain-containing protein [Saprospiraceae 